ncbi:hypothetical protein ACFVWY_08515 [Streptomyces sp. NPDC058195]|uniref:hypothetical protein n=1 Tax=Streptomyces sp. NPDC058195 TaxID=3346375 RepID=UPI0036E5C898
MKHFKRALAGGAASIALASGLLGATTGQASAVQAASAKYGCNSGSACIYPEGEFDYRNSKPTNQYLQAGVHQLFYQEGYHWIFNNQTDGWTIRMCTGSNGTGCDAPIPPGGAVWMNLTPVNSVVIQP